MTGLEGNRQIYLPQEFLLTEVQPRSIELLGGDLKGQIDSILPEGPVIICFIIPLCYSKNGYFNWMLISSTMGLITNNTCLNDHKFFLE